MTFDEYKKLCQERPPRWRKGQTYFNRLYEHRPDLSEQVRGSWALDPFHRDEVVPDFLEWVERHWSDS